MLSIAFQPALFWALNSGIHSQAGRSVRVLSYLQTSWIFHVCHSCAGVLFYPLNHCFVLGGGGGFHNHLMQTELLSVDLGNEQMAVLSYLLQPL